jgi:hypothetical protein
MPKLAESTTAVIVRGEKWEGVCASEPYEAGWAREAVLFLRLLAREGETGAALFRVQVSPDGMRWVDEGATILVPEEPEQVTFAKVAHFANWLRVEIDLPEGAMVQPLITLHLKG